MAKTASELAIEASAIVLDWANKTPLRAGDGRPMVDSYGMPIACYVLEALRIGALYGIGPRLPDYDYLDTDNPAIA